MAEEFFRKYAPEGFEPMSAGTKPTSQVNPLAIQVMNEIGIGISKQRSKDLIRSLYISHDDDRKRHHDDDDRKRHHDDDNNKRHHDDDDCKERYHNDDNNKRHHDDDDD